MTKKVFPLFVLITLAACLLSYKFGSAPAAHAQSLPPSPGTWTLYNAGGNTSGTISVTRPAGGSGVQHVATCVIATYQNSRAAGSGTSDTVYLWDGNVNGTVLLQWDLSALTGSSDSVKLCNLNVVGTANTPMTLSIANG